MILEFYSWEKVIDQTGNGEHWKLDYFDSLNDVRVKYQGSNVLLTISIPYKNINVGRVKLINRSLTCIAVKTFKRGSRKLKYGDILLLKFKYNRETAGVL